MIKPILDSLRPDQKDLLMYAFENNISQRVKLKDGRFIGVHINEDSDTIIEERVGNWVIGKKHDPPIVCKAP